MFTKLPNLKTPSQETISIEQLYSLIKNNPQEHLLIKLRNTIYKSQQYNSIKEELNCIIPHGIFNGLGKTDIVSYSEYLYFDIDGFDTQNQLNDTKKELFDTLPIALICKSCGGKGLSFLIKIDTLNKLNDTLSKKIGTLNTLNVTLSKKNDTLNKLNDTLNKLNDTLSNKIGTLNTLNVTFEDIHSYVREILIGKGFNIDKAAGGLARKMIISSDNEVLISDRVMDIDLGKVVKIKNVGGKKVNEKSSGYTLNDTFKIIPFNILLTQIKTKIEYNKPIIGDYIIDKFETYTIIIPKVIQDGQKHRIYTRIINALYYINDNITQEQIFSYLVEVNKRATIPWDLKYLFNYVRKIGTNIESTGECSLKTRTKIIQFNPNSNLTKKQKQIMAAKINGKLKTSKTIERIKEAILQCADNNEIPTQKRIASMLDIGIATIKRNWKEATNNSTKEISIIDIPKEEIEMEPPFETLDEGTFLGDTPIPPTPKNSIIVKYNHKNLGKIIELEISKEEVKLFDSKVKELGKNICETLIIDELRKQMEEYKIYFMWNKWLLKHPIYSSMEQDEYKLNQLF